MANSAHPNRLSLTIEVIYGHAFKAKPASSPKGDTVISLEHMKNMLSGDIPPP